MSFKQGRKVLLAFLLAACVVVPGFGQARRALLIGTQTYLPNGSPVDIQTCASAPKPVPGMMSRCDGPVWPNLEGSLNDVDTMHDILASPKFGFTEIHELRDRQKGMEATRENILSAMRRFIVDEANAGDIIVFYYAGHGSQQYNSKTDKPLHLDESIVPIDANEGAMDVRDKEIARIFNAAIDKGIKLTAIFDSCHSGTIARGIPIGEASKARFLSYNPFDARDPGDKLRSGKPKPAPEERENGALIVSAAQHYELAQEWKTNSGVMHGAFTVALSQALEEAPSNTPARDVFKKLMVIMDSMPGVRHTPVLAGKRDSEPLFGGRDSDQMLVVVAKNGVHPESGKIELIAGQLTNLGPGTELTKVGTDTDATILRIEESPSLTRSLATALSGDFQNVSPGDLFKVDKWVPVPNRRLQVWLPPALDQDLLRKATREHQLLKQAGVTVLRDPVQSLATHLLSWNGSVWEIRALQNSALGKPVRSELGVDPTVKQIVNALGPNKSAAKVIISYPPTPELVRALSLNETSTSAVEVVREPASAQYILSGRLCADCAGETLEYSWVRANSGESQESAQQRTKLCAVKSPYPPRTDWFHGSDSQLQSAVLRLAQLNAWLHLEAPPSSVASASSNFPYRLALVHADGPNKGKKVAGETMHKGELIQFELELSRRPSAWSAPHWVYVLDLQCDGRGVRLYPQTGEGNLLPTPDPNDPNHNKWIDPIPLFKEPVPIEEPFGRDTLIMITTSERLQDTSFMNFEASVTRGAPSEDPLQELFNSASSGVRGVRPPAVTPTSWTLLQVTVDSTDAQRSSVSAGVSRK